MAEILDVSIDRLRSLTVTFDDGVTASFAVTALRQACPCATCRGRSERGLPAWEARPGAATPSIVSAEFVGAWGLSVRWDDGHDTGIYAWDLLRRWHERATLDHPVPVVAADLEDPS